ncbi:MAG: hypothetical protein E7573_00195 [Ruminococcaceae bacterium]|nr:hypothetical protein [Oscillospiraceae bacterium]
MSFLRNRNEERTGFQSGSPLLESIDCQSDFVMVYRLDETTSERIKQHREAGYVIHFMTGIAWGRYQDYLYGEYDGVNHWDEAQQDRFGNLIVHGKDVPYMVPTVSFADYLSDKLRIVVDAGIEAIHVEEPEFWDRGGYSPAFKREYELYYREPWSPPHESVDAKYKCGKLKAYLYTRTIDRLSSSLKEYAKTKYNRDIRFYVPTHSLINYTQWKIVSPEGKLSDIPAVDGCIAQVWTGTSREKNWFNGILKERTFETAYLEYGVMQELTKGTGKNMWFLHDPIEDNPVFDWDDYRKNYLCTVVASLLHPKVNKYEICPWPNRVFEDKYPKNSANALSIPEDYATILNNTFHTLGTLEGCNEPDLRVGILVGDCQLYQREYPDSFFSDEAKETVGTVLNDNEELIKRFREELFYSSDNKELMLKFMSSNAFPAFFSMALPLLKFGIPVRPVLLDNMRRYVGYLDDYDMLLMSYEYMKPDYPDINNSIASWVKEGGQLIYIGDGFDPYNNINSWWTDKYDNPAEHLFSMLGINLSDNKEIFSCGNGTAAVWKINPSVFAFSEKNAQSLREFFCESAARKGQDIQFNNHLTIQRGPYIIASVMDESINDEPLVFEGLFCDMFSPKFDIITEKVLFPNDKAMMRDLYLSDSSVEIIGTSVRVENLTTNEKYVELLIAGAGCFTANIRIRLPFNPSEVTVDDNPVEFVYEALASTVLITFKSKTGKRIVKIYK